MANLLLESLTLVKVNANSKSGIYQEVMLVWNLGIDRH
jgi:hypothetical protein